MRGFQFYSMLGDKSSISNWGGLGQNLKMGKPKFPNLLISEH